MSAPSALPQFAAVIVAAGKGLRSGGAIPKQFANWRGKPVLRHSAEALAAARQGLVGIVRIRCHCVRGAVVEPGEVACKRER